MRVAVIGSREIPGFVDVDYVIRRIPLNCTEIVSGGAIGIDQLAKEAGKRLNIPVREILPQYAANGRSAPFIRDVEIITSVDLVIAIRSNKSRGTSFVLAECVKRHIPFRLYDVDFDCQQDKIEL